jgi:thioredoxin-dependent peroxiredoxin
MKILRRNFISILLAGLLAGCLSLIIWVNFTPTAAALGGKLPAINQPAPSFTLPTNTGNGKISLSDLRGKWVVLYFYPKDFTSGCTIEARRFQQDLPKYLAKNTQVIGVSADDVDSHAEFCDGSWIGYVSMRHSFIIDPKGTIRATFVKVNPNIHSQEVLARLEKLQSTNT